MFRRTLFFGILTAALVAAVHFLAVKHDLYFMLWWLDIPMHIVGGMAIATLGLWFFGSLRERYAVFSDLREVALLVFAWVLFGGVAWELYENLAGYTFNTVGNYKLDIMKDLLMDLSGAGIVLYVYIKSRLKKSKEYAG